MAVAVVAFVGTKAVDAEAIGGWNTGNADGDIFVEGSGSIGAKVSNATQDFYDLSITGSPYDFSSGGADEGDHLFAWFNALTPVSLHGIIAVDDLGTDSLGYWDVGPPVGYGGGWINYVVDPANNDDFTVITAGSGSWTGTGNPAQLTGVDGFGGRHTTSTSIMGNFNNALVDAVSVGSGYRITRGDSTDADATFADIITYEQNSSNRFGALRSEGGVLFMMSKVIIGDTTANNHDFTDDGFTVIWLDTLASSTFYELSAEEGSGATNVSLSNGTLKAEDPTQTALPLIDLTGVTDWTNTNVNITGARAINLDGNVTITGGTWESCGQIDLGGQPTIDDLTVLDPTDDGAMLVNAANELDNISDVTFDGAGIGGTTADAALEIDISAAGPHTINLDNITFQNRVGSSVDMYFVDQGADRTYTVNVLNGGTTPTFTKARAGDSVTINNSVTLTLTNVVVGSNCSIHAEAGGPETVGTELMNEAAVSSTVTESYNYSTSQPVVIRVRRSQDGSTKYKVYEEFATITGAGLTQQVNQQVDPFALDPA